LLVKAGKLTVIFPARKTCHFFRIYFSGIPILGILVPHPKPNRKTEPYSGEVPFHIAVILPLSEAERGRTPAFSPVAHLLLIQRHRQGATFFTNQTSNRKRSPGSAKTARLDRH